MSGRLAVPPDRPVCEIEESHSPGRVESPGDVGVGSMFYSEVRQLTSSMQEKLTDHIRDLDPAQYMAAKRFLLSVSYESQQPLVARSLAIR